MVMTQELCGLQGSYVGLVTPSLHYYFSIT